MKPRKQIWLIKNRGDECIDTEREIQKSYQFPSSASGFKYTVPVAGSALIWINNLEKLGTESLMIETPNLDNYISASKSRTRTVYISPYSQQ